MSDIKGDSEKIREFFTSPLRRTRQRSDSHDQVAIRTEYLPHWWLESNQAGAPRR